MKKMKIAFLCIYSHPSICGVWTRVSSLSQMLVKEGHEVHVFSTNIIKGTGKTSCQSESFKGVKIHRFNPRFSFGENVKFWNFSKELENLNPDLIIAEVYRHPHTTLALKIAKKIKKPIFLVTHAPFVEPELRSWIGNIIVSLYDKLYGRRINHFNKIITITKWEIPYLLKLGADRSKIEYIPNGIQEEFFKIKRKKGSGILFLGRISPIKNLEVLIHAMKNVKSHLTIAGPAEETYKQKLIMLIKKLKLTNVKFLPAVYDIKAKIKLIDSHNIFVLPSKREAMPQSLIEAMSRGKIVIASNNNGTCEIVKSGENGFIFPQNNAEKLVKLINFSENIKNLKKLDLIRKEAIKTSEKFKWSKIFQDFLKLI